jgi:hypothetical protein
MPTDERLTVAQAADRLGISEDAVRGRIKRGTLRSEREDGAVYVLLGGRPTNDQPTTNETTVQPTDPRDELIAVLREQLAAEREANRENRRLLLAALERPVRGLEAGEEKDPPESAEAPETDAQRPPWWRRIFVGGG